MVVLREKSALLMIDFRYHLVSIIAVFLALGLGILMGTAVLNDALVDSLQNDIEALNERVDSRQAEIERLDRRVDAADAFANEAAPWLTTDALQGRTVVVLQLEGTNGDMVGALRDSIEGSGGEVVSTIVFLDRFALDDQVEREQLALALASSSGDASELRVEAGTMLGARLAGASAEASTSQRPQGMARTRLQQTLRELQEAEFLGVDAPQDGDVVPSNSMFLVLGGDPSEPAYDAGGLVTSLGGSLSSRGGPTLVAEPAESRWGIVTSVREDAETATRVATVDQADTTEGRVAVVLGLARAFQGTTDHYGVGPGATQVIPDPAPAP